MNVAFHHRRIHPQLPSLGHSSLPRQFHHPLVQLLNDFRLDQLPQSCQGLGVRHFFIPNPGKGAIHQIRPHLSSQHVIAPVANVFQQQQTQHHLGWRCSRPRLRLCGYRSPCASYTVSRSCSSSSNSSTSRIHGSHNPSISSTRPRCHGDGC
jgi:hypothetical protein